MRTVFFDVDTQIDFLFPAGALYVPGAETILPAIARLNQYAASNGIPLISTADAHAEDDPEFAQYPAHCVRGTVGQLKPQATLVAGQRIVEKQTLDCFACPALEPVLRELAADRYVVYGVVTEICVRYAALGLLKTGKQVELVTDAVRHLNERGRDGFLAELQAAGGALTTVERVKVAP